MFSNYYREIINQIENGAKKGNIRMETLYISPKYSIPVVIEQFKLEGVKAVIVIERETKTIILRIFDNNGNENGKILFN